MAKVPYKNVIEFPYAGWATDLSSSSSRAVLGLPGEYSRSTGISLMRPGFEGCIAPGPTWTALAESGTQKMVAKALNGVVANLTTQGEAFVVLRNARLVQFGTNNETIDTKYDVTAHGGHTVATSDNADVFQFTDTGGTSRVVWSWEDDVDADISLITANTGGSDDGGSMDNDWFSTRTSSGVLTKGVPLKMWLSPDNKLCCTNGRYIATYDDVSGIGNTQALDVSYGFTTVAGAPYGLWNAIVGYKKNTANPFAATAIAIKGEVRMWLWNARSPSFEHEYVIDDNFVTEIKNINGSLYVWTQGRNGTTKMLKFVPRGKFDSFDTVFESAQIGNAPIHGGVDSWFNHSVWGTDSGRLLAYGSPNPSKFPSGFHYISYKENFGMVQQLFGSALYAGHATSGNAYTIQKLSIDSNYVIGSHFRTQLFPVPTNTTLTNFKFYFTQNGSGASMTVSLFKDYNTISVGGANDLLNTTLTNSNTAGATYYPIQKTIDQVNSYYLVLTFDHAAESDTAFIIRKIEVEGFYDTDTV